jgi:hypothetical protein
MTGWECPRCGQCYAPLVEKCSGCKPRTGTGTGEAVGHYCISDWTNTGEAPGRCMICGAQMWPEVFILTWTGQGP